MEPVSPRLMVSIPSPGHQVTMILQLWWRTHDPCMTFSWNDLKTDEEKPMLASDWSISSMP